MLPLQHASKYLARTSPTLLLFNRNKFPFDGSSIERKPIAGSETAIISIARELKKLSWNVCVCCEVEHEGVYSGVPYFHHEKTESVSDFLIRETGGIDVFVSARDVRPFIDLRPPARNTIFWMSDLPSERTNPLPAALPNIDSLFFVSHFQKNSYQAVYQGCLPPEKIFVTRNGVDVTRFHKKVPRIPGKCVYTTTPFRGLDVLLQVWPRIHDRVPGASLDVYSSMSIYNIEDPPEIQAVFKRGRSIADQYRISFHAPVRQDLLARILLEASAMLFPSTFEETSCIAAIEAVCAKTMIVTTAHSALTETVQEGEGILINGDPYSPAYQDQFVNAAVETLQSARQPVSRRDLSWTTVAREWNAKFSQLMASS